MRPTFALTSSAASGFLFCGIIEEPVEKPSDNSRNLKAADAHSTISSARRDRCTDAIDRADSSSIAKSRADTASREFAIGLSNPRDVDVI